MLFECKAVSNLAIICMFFEFKAVAQVTQNSTFASARLLIAEVARRGRRLLQTQGQYAERESRKNWTGMVPACKYVGVHLQAPNPHSSL